MDLTVNTNQGSQGQVTNSSLTGSAAPQTESQRVQQSGEAVNASREKAGLDDSSRNLEERKFNTIKEKSAKFAKGDNAFLSNISFTIYNKTSGSDVGNYEIKFTNLTTGTIETKPDVELLAGSSLISGSV